MLLALSICLLFAFCAPWLYKLLGRFVVIPMTLLPLGIFAYLYTLVPAVLAGNYPSFKYTWVPSLGISLHFRADGLGLFFGLLVSFFGALVMFYAAGYLKGHPLLGRFYLYLTLFMTAMLGLVLSDNFFCLFVFWELTSISSYLLIGFENKQEKSRVAAWQALLVTGTGGLALLGGLILITIITGSYSFSELLALDNNFTQHPYFLPALILLMLGCFTKSAQFPFHFWLPNAMAAPTPVSAYLHSATMVKAGVYLLARLTPVLSGAEAWHYSLVVVGGCTALLGAFLALQHTDMKAILAYTTISALGQMVNMIGIGTTVALKAMLVFLLAHALYKGTMFLAAGSVDHSTGTRDIRKLNGLARVMPVTAMATTLAALSMAGLMPFFGFIGKELIYEAALNSRFYVWLVFGLTFLTGIAYVAVAATLSFGIFWRKVKKVTKVEHSPSFYLYIPTLTLGLLGIAFGLAPKPVVVPILTRAIQSISGKADLVLKLSLWHGLTKELGLSVLTLLLGAVLYFYLGHLRNRKSILEPVYAYGPDQLYHLLFNGFLHYAKKFIAAIQNGNLRRYVIYIILFYTGLVMVVLWQKAPPIKLENRVDWLMEMAFHDVVIFALVIAALLYILGTRSRLTSIVVMGLVGYSAALVYVLYGAPDVAATQFLIETLTVVIFVLLLHKLPAFIYLSHQFKKYKYIAVSLLFGAVMTYTMLVVQDQAVVSELQQYYGENSVTKAHGRNIVNVILVDFRALDTLGEITVLAVAALGIFALLRMRTEKGDKT